MALGLVVIPDTSDSGRSAFKGMQMSSAAVRPAHFRQMVCPDASRAEAVGSVVPP